MDNNKSEQTHKELLQLAACELGNYHRPSTYIEWVRDNYGIEPSSSSTTKALGAWSTRLRTDEARAVGVGKELLELCYYDKGLASYVLAKAGRA